MVARKRLWAARSVACCDDEQGQPVLWKKKAVEMRQCFAEVEVETRSIEQTAEKWLVGGCSSFGFASLPGTNCFQHAGIPVQIVY
jgi:hypothetical protein